MSSEVLIKNLVWILPVCVFLYIAWDIWKSKKKGQFKTFTIEGFKSWVSQAKTKDYVIGFLIFLAVFLIARFFLLGQNLSQECYVWKSIQGIDDKYKQEMDNISKFVANLTTLEVSIENNTGIFYWGKLEQGRSYNYYYRLFREKGKPQGINIYCFLRPKTFIKNLKLDYNGGKQRG